ncbi:MAG: response regulator [Acidobacteriota bacterium]|nr:response regulator [Acidobacteriota bacterium]
MNEHPDELRQQIEALQERVSRLSAAVLRMSASLDLDTVLQEAVDSARALTGARYGTIATVDETGRPEDFVTSGFTPDERQELANWPEGPQLFEHLRNLEAPLRIADLPAYVRTLGLSSDLIRSKSLQGAPMLHRGVHVGNFFLAEKESGGEFTSADEEVLMLFAAQAAIAIANARTHRDEQRARSDLETLIETSPVGVVVLDARTGRLVWVNREARRITEPLRTPDTTLEGLLKGLIARRADGREIVFAEFPLVQQIGVGETVRAEEFTFSVSSGRSISALVNATPIRTADGEVESYVATMQDLTPLKEAERQRTEFLSLVSHELRAPLISIKGSTATVLGAAPAPDPAEMLQFFRVIDERANHMRGLIADLLDQGRIETGTLSVSPELAEVARLVDQARNTFVSGGGRHTLRIDLPENLPRVLVDRGRIVQVLNNLLANAARHSPESSAIGVTATHDGVHVAISVSDEGRGVAPDRLPHLFRKRARGGDEDRGFGANGLGLVICKGLVEAHGGRIWAESGGLGRGTRFIFTVPVAEDSGRGAVAAVPSRSRPSRDVHAQTRILVVDDDPQTLRYVRDALTEAGYSVFVTGDPEALPDLIRSHQPSLVLLDVVLPGTDGIELMESVPELADLPVIFISVYGRDETIVRALDAGAADYLVKPFSPSELTARVRAALRVRAEPAPFLLDELSIDYDMRRVEVAGEAVELTATEYQLLRVLSMNAGRVLTFDSLLRQAWRGRKSAGDPKLVRAVVKRLRRKLGDDAANPTYVRNERGVGYRMPKPNDG